MTGEEKRQYRREWKAEYPDLVREQRRRWRAKQPDKVKDANRRWRENHPEQARELSRQAAAKWRDGNREHLNEYMREYQSDWRETHPDYTKIHKWMNQQYPRTGRCEMCGHTDKPTEYASVGHTYTYNRADWFELCRLCHKAFDGHAGNGTPGNH